MAASATLTPPALDPLRWIRAHVTTDGGVAVSRRNRAAYPEVTGYLIPNLLAAGERELAVRFGRFLLLAQRPDGSFAGPDGGTSYAFDTGQVLRGLCALCASTVGDEAFADAARRAADWLCDNAHPDGRLLVPDDPATAAAWDMGARGRIPEAVHLYVLPALLQAADVLDERRYAQTALRARDQYLRQPDALRFQQRNMLSHFLGYVHEALIDLGAHELAAGAYAEVAALQRDDGGVPAFADVRWTCLPGQLQAAIVWQKLGEHARAEAALQFAERLQRPDGGFPGSVGPGASYFADDEPSWAVKFWLDVRQLRDGGPTRGHATPVDARPRAAAAVLDRNLDPAEWHRSIAGGQQAQQIADRVRAGDAPAWLAPLLQETRAGERCLELGSGTGELSASLALHGRSPLLLDFSRDSLALSAAVLARCGRTGAFLQADVTAPLPLAGRAVDVVWSSGLLEHFTPGQIEHIVAESARIARRAVIALVPNARSLPYRLGKQQQERRGTWAWGHEEPLASLSPVFERAGLRRVREWTIAPEHALEFLDDPAHRATVAALRAFYAELSQQQLEELGQGYLLVTVGEVGADDHAVDDPTATTAASPRLRAGRRLAVVPNDPLAAYADAGYPDLTDYFNPAGAFDEVFCLSPHERREHTRYGMRVLPTLREEFAARVRELGVDVVRAYCLPSGHFACADKVEGVPYVVSVHDPNPERCPGPLPAADRFLAVSGCIEQFLRDKGAEDGRVRRLPNRVDLSVFRPIDDPAARAAWQRRFPGRHRILHVGRRSAEKNLETLIDALARLGPDYTGIFVGRGDDAQYRERAERAGASCHFHDAVPNAELAQWYSFADVMCVPSLWEGFGVVFVEALACGAAVVTSDRAPMNEFVEDGHSGLLVADPQDPAELAAALRRVCTDAELAGRLRRNARPAAAPFAKDAVDRQEAGFYRDLLAGAAPRRNAPVLPRPDGDLPGSLRLHLRTPDLAGEWDALVRGSPDAWVFHLDDWQRCQLQSFPLQDLSFLVELDGRLVAACPLQRHRDRPQILTSTFMGTGGPALRGDLEPALRGEVLRLCHRLHRRFVDDGVAAEVRTLLPQLSHTSRAHHASRANPLVAHGYDGHTATTTIVDLARSEDDLLAAIRPGHRRPIRAALRRLGVDLELGELHGQEGTDDYYRLHVETYTRTGVPPHPRAYFDAIGEHMVARGHARTFAVRDRGELVAAANVATFGDGGLYWTGAYAGSALRSGVGKLLQWHAIRTLKDEGRLLYETGEVFPTAAEGTKEHGLSLYKRGFGGALRPWFQGTLRRPS